jgi:hypothetical protein
MRRVDPRLRNPMKPSNASTATHAHSAAQMARSSDTVRVAHPAHDDETSDENDAVNALLCAKARRRSRW